MMMLLSFKMLCMQNFILSPYKHFVFPPPPTSVGDPNNFCSDPDLGPFISYTYIS